MTSHLNVGWQVYNNWKLNTYPFITILTARSKIIIYNFLWEIDP